MRLINELDIAGDGQPLSYNYSRQDTFFTESQMHKVGFNIVPTRALDTTYQNTSGRARMCIISCILSAATGANDATASGAIGSVSPPLAYTARIGSIASGDIRASMTFIVPNGWYYQCKTALVGGGTCDLSLWAEYDLHSAAPRVES